MSYIIAIAITPLTPADADADAMPLLLCHAVAACWRCRYRRISIISPCHAHYVRLMFAAMMIDFRYDTFIYYASLL